MKMKDIVIVAVAVVMMGVSGYFIYKMLMPTPASQQNNTNTQTNNTLSEEEYNATLKLLSEKKDYGEATLDNIGRTNPFGPLN